MRKLPIIEVRAGEMLTLQDGASYVDVPMELVDSDHEPKPGELAVHGADGRWTVGDAPAKAETTKVIGSAKDAKDAGLS